MILIDLLLVFFITWSLSIRREFDLLNPLLIFLGFHVVFVSMRLIQIFVLGSEIISNKWLQRQIMPEELWPALIAADLCLLGFYLGFRSINLTKQNLIKPIVYVEKNNLAINVLLIITLICGAIGSAISTNIGGASGTFAVEQNIWTTLLANAGMISAILLIYCKGFKPHYLLILGVFIMIYALQGGQRYRVILPLIFLASLYIKKNHINGIPKKFIVVGVLLFVITLSLKSIGRNYQLTGQLDISTAFSKSYDEVLEGESGDLSFIEQSAAMITGVNERGSYFYGETYLPIFFFWVPKTMWTEKPALNDWQYQISSSGREFSTLGQISLLSGEAYANFGYLGALMVPFLVGRLFGFFYRSYRNLPYQSKGFLILLLFNMVLFQVWRDGLISLFLFPILNYFSIFLLILIKQNKAKLIT